MEACQSAKLFFSFLEEQYVFFTSSTDRYELLLSNLNKAAAERGPRERAIAPKRVSTTRWSSRADAAKCLRVGYSEIKATLEELAQECCTARGLLKQMNTLENGIYTAVWSDILERVNAVNVKLQNPKIDINTSISLMKSLQTYNGSIRDSFN